METEIKLIKAGSAILLGLAVLAWAYWVIVMCSFIVPRIFVDGVWQDLRIVENHAVISTKAKVIYGSMWIVSIATGSGAFLAGANMLSYFWRGQLFTHGSVRSIFWLGLALVVAMVWDTILDGFDHAILTMDNTGTAIVDATGQVVSAGKRYIPPSYDYDSGDISLMLCGFGFCLLGFVLRVAQRVDAENKEFI